MSNGREGDEDHEALQDEEEVDIPVSDMDDEPGQLFDAGTRELLQDLFGADDEEFRFGEEQRGGSPYGEEGGRECGGSDMDLTFGDSQTIVGDSQTIAGDSPRESPEPVG